MTDFDVIHASLMVLPAAAATAWPFVLACIGLIGLAVFVKSSYEEKQRSRRLALTLDHVRVARERLQRRQARALPSQEPIPARLVRRDPPAMPNAAPSRLAEHLLAVTKKADQVADALEQGLPIEDVHFQLARLRGHLRGLAAEYSPRNLGRTTP